jgi:hypothetical protein
MEHSAEVTNSTRHDRQQAAPMAIAARSQSLADYRWLVSPAAEP